MKKPSLSQLETFLMVAQELNMTRAAVKLQRSKAAISAHIKQLEEDLKIPLFLRSTRQIKLSDEGYLLFQQCQRLKEELDGTFSLMQQIDAEPQGCLRLTANPLMTSPLVKLVQHYKQRFPQMRVDILMEERMPDMKKENIDIVYGVNWPPPSHVVAKVIGQTRYILSASPQYLAHFDTPKTLNALTTHQLLHHLGRQTVLVNLKKPQSPAIHPTLCSNNQLFLKECALSHMGVILTHDYIVAEELKTGSLMEILKGHFHEQIPLYVYYNKERFVQPKIRQFIHLIDELTH